MLCRIIILGDKMLNNYRNKDIKLFEKVPSISIYEELVLGLRKGLPKGF